MHPMHKVSVKMTQLGWIMHKGPWMDGNASNAQSTCEDKPIGMSYA